MMTQQNVHKRLSTTLNQLGSVAIASTPWLLLLITLFYISDAVAAGTAASGATPELEKPSKLLAYIAAGIGIFLVGIKYTGSHLEQMTGGAFKNIVTRISGTHQGKMLAGTFLGFVTQSGKASSLILAGFVQADLLPSRRAMPIVAWCNAGASLIVVASILPIKIIVMFLLGITGLGITFHFPKKMFHVYGVIFGICMIMYGLFLLKSGASGFIDYPWLPPFLEQIKGIFLLSLVAGILLTLVAQSDMAVAMITIAMVSSGLLAVDEAAMMVYGTQIGIGLITYGFSFNFSGRARQVVISEVFYKFISTILFVLLFYIELYTGLPLVLAAAEMISTNAAVQVAVIVLSISIVGASVNMLLTPFLATLIEKLYPPSEHEILSEPQYLTKLTGQSPETGLILVENEQLRLMERLPAYLDSARSMQIDQHSDKTSPDVFHAAFNDISNRIGDTLSEISSLSLNEAITQKMIRTVKFNELFITLEGNVYKAATRLSNHSEESSTAKLGTSILEGMDFMILTALDSIKSRQQDDLDALIMLTDDRSSMMDETRRKYFQTSEELSNEERNFIMDITILFENTVLTLRRYAELMQQPVTE